MKYLNFKLGAIATLVIGSSLVGLNALALALVDPSSLTLTSTNSSVSASWYANGNETSSTIYEISGNGFSTVTTSDTNTSLNSLTPNTLYTITVKAQDTNDGSTTGGTLNTIYTKANDPSGVDISLVNTSSLNLFWSPNNNPSGTIYQISGNNNFVSVTTSENNLLLSNLTPSTSYNLGVTSMNNDNSLNNRIFAPNTTTLNIVTVVTSTETNTTTTSTDNSGNSGGSGGNSTSTVQNVTISQAQIDDSVNKLLNYLKSNQSNDGKVFDTSTADWAAISFGANNIYSSDIKSGDKSLYDFIYNYIPTSATEDNVCAAYPRHILALLSSGVSDSDTKIIDLKNKINTECVHADNFGIDGINDDVFGLIALIASGENPNSKGVKITTADILANQNPTSGAFTWPGWGGGPATPGPDITGAAINALKYAQNNGVNINESVFTNAKQYLKTSQLADGGWGCDSRCSTSDALTTSWAVMGINTLGQNQNDWFNSVGKNPWYILTDLNGDHFTYSYSGSTYDDWFGTKHAVPALLGKSWPIILSPKTTAASNSGGLFTETTSTPSTTSTIATSTPIIATTTVVIATTTPTTTIETTSTPNELLTLIKTENPIPTIYANSKISTSKPKIKTTPSSTESQFTASPAITAPNQIVDDLPLDTPTKRAVKKLLEISGGGAVAVGAYLGLRLLKNVL